LAFVISSSYPQRAIAYDKWEIILYQNDMNTSEKENKQINRSSLAVSGPTTIILPLAYF
jgi:hypothetical protein